MQKLSLFLCQSRGSLLVASIWVLTILAILGTGLYKTSSSQIKVAKTLEERLLSQYAAESACEFAHSERFNDDTLQDTLFELAQPYQKELGKAEFSFTMVDEERKININTVPTEIIASLPGLNQEIAKSISDSPLRPFQQKEELLLVSGMTEEIFVKCIEFITIYGSGSVNINTAPKETLAALGLDNGLIDTIGKFRAGKDAQEATEDDVVFKETSNIINDLKTFTDLSINQEQTLAEIINKGLLTVKSENFDIQIQTMVLGKPVLKYNIVLDKEEIRQWREE